MPKQQTGNETPASRNLNIELAQDYLNQMLTGTGKDIPVTYEEIFDFLASVDPSLLQELTGEYIKMEENSSYFFTFEGMTTKTIKGKPVVCAILVDRNKNKGIYGGAVLRQSLESVTQLPVFVRIDTKNWESAKDGEYLNMKVFVLPVAASAKSAHETF